MIAIVLLAVTVQMPDSTRLRIALDRALQQVVNLQAMPLSPPVVQRRAVAEFRAEALLDTVVLQRSWGRTVLSVLRRRYPNSALLLNYDARLAEKQERWSEAIDLREQMIRQTPADTAVQRAYAELLDRSGRSIEAKQAYLRWFETAPENEAPFRALLRMNPDYDDLLERVQRMQIRLRDSKVLKNHEIELLHKMGRKP
ncbi:MAG TPA: hypothetical protein VM100_05470 [Longimicrobiales bacterium]|nr:hypothetical protein [Longimicrobiales bacterium]